MEAKKPHKARICCLYSYGVLLCFIITFIVPRALFLLDVWRKLELRCRGTGGWRDSAHPLLQKMSPILHTQCLLVCLCGFTGRGSCGGCTWKKPSRCPAWGHPGQFCCHQCSQRSSPPLPLSYELVGQGHIQTPDRRARVPYSQFERILSWWAMPDSLDAQICASCRVKPSQLGFAALETVSSVQFVPALRVQRWCPDWKAAQVLQSWELQIILQVAKSQSKAFWSCGQRLLRWLLNVMGKGPSGKMDGWLIGALKPLQPWDHRISTPGYEIKIMQIHC